MQKILVTGAAGFIGFHLCLKLTGLGYSVLGIDNINNYYDPGLKYARLNQLSSTPNFQFHKLDLIHQPDIEAIFSEFQPEIVIHLAAQAGVRYSLENPHAYIDSNITGFLNILEACRHYPVQHLLFASSSSVYGANTKVPFAVDDPVNKPISIYAVTKRTNELMAYTYSHLYQIPTTGLRFFTVYGAWGRPDMAYFSFTQKIIAGMPIQLFNQGQMRRDFTYIDDVITCIYQIATLPPSLPIPYQLFNIGHHQPIKLLHFVEILEECIGIKAIKEFLPAQPGDLPETYADIESLISYTNYKPSTDLKTGLTYFVEWYRAFYLDKSI